jgi:acyl-CoA oxidase
MGQIFRTVQLIQEIQDPKLLEALRMALIQYSESFSMRFYVHEFLFKGALNMFGTEEQKEEWLPKIAKCQVFGCFAMVSVESFLARCGH